MLRLRVKQIEGQTAKFSLQDGWFPVAQPTLHRIKPPEHYWIEQVGIQKRSSGEHLLYGPLDSCSRFQWKLRTLVHHFLPDALIGIGAAGAGSCRASVRTVTAARHGFRLRGRRWVGFRGCDVWLIIS